MSVLHAETDVLRELERELTAREPMKGGLDSVRLAEKIRAVRQLLSKDEATWVGTSEAAELLGVGSEDMVNAWARSARLRSRTLSNGRVQVSLDDVLRHREMSEGLTAIDRGEDISEEELDRLVICNPPLYPGGPGISRGPANAQSVVVEGSSPR